MERKTLREIAVELRNADLEELKLLCGEKVPHTVLRLSTSPIELLERLDRMGLVTCSSRSWLRSMLENIRRDDIVRKYFHSDEPDLSTSCIRLGLRKRVSNFVRDEERLQIETCLVKQDHAVTVVVADGGMGKTALVTEVGHSLTEQGISVVYFSLRGLHTVEEGASQFLKLFDLRPGDNSQNEAINLVQELKEKTVIIVDNIDHLMESSVPDFESENDILKFIADIEASQDKVKIVATSRKEVHFGNWFNWPLKPLSEGKATYLLRKLNGSLLTPEQATKRAKLSGGSPLRLKILASIRAGTSPSDSPVFHQPIPELSTILAVWFKEFGDLRNTALKLTVFPAKFTIKDVEIFFSLIGNTETHLLGDRLRSLTDRCLLNKDGDLYAIHQSIKSFLESHAKETDPMKEVLQTARECFIHLQISKLDDMCKQFLSPNPDPAIAEFSNAKRHIVEAFMKAVEGWGVSDSLKHKCIDSTNKTIEFLSKVMGRTELENLLLLFADYCKCQEDQRRFSECYTSIGVKIIYSCTCQVLCSGIQKRASKYLNRANEIQVATGINEGYSRAQCLGKLGRCYALMETSGGNKDRDYTCANDSAATKNAEALHKVNSAVHLRRENEGTLESVISLAISHHDAAAVLSYKGYHDEARQTREEHVLQVYKKYLGDDHPFTATLLNCIGNDYCSLGDNEEAEPLFREALDIRRRHLGENHQETARSYHDLGKCLAEKKDYQQALKMLRTALEIQQWIGDIPHEEIITRQQILSILESLGKTEEAVTMREELKACEERVKRV